MKLSTDKFIFHIKNNFLIYLILLTALILRLLFMSPYLEDWDSVQFALAIHHFSILDQQPHPPGYPIYVFMAKVINFILNNDLASLNLLSALLGSLIGIPFYLLVQKMTKRSIAIISTVLLLITPVSWTLSEVPLSNIPGMAFLILSAYLLYRGKNSMNYFLIGCFFAGFILGVRFAEYSIVIPLIILLLIVRKGQGLLKSIILFLLGVFTWLIPMIWITGFDNFLKAYTSQVTYIASHDSLFSQNTSLRFRLFRINQLFNWGYTQYFILLFIPLLLILIKKTRSVISFEYVFATIWLFSYLIPLTFAYNLEVTRYTLPLLPPLILLFALSLNKIKNKLIFIFCLIILSLIFINSFEQVQKLHTLLPPTIAPVLYVKNNFSPSETILVTTFTYRQFQYYNPQFQNYYGTQEINENILKDTVIIDFWGLKEDIPQLKNYKLTDTKDFTGPEIIFPRVPKVSLFIFRRSDQ